MKAKNRIVVTMLVVFNILFNGFGTLLMQPVYAEGMGRELISLPSSEQLPRDSSGNKTIFTDVLLTLNGKVVSESNPLRKGDTFQVDYEFSIPDTLGKEMQDGDYFNFNLPPDLILAGGQSGELKDPANGLVYGSYSSDASGRATMSFNSEVQKHDNVEGRLRFSVTMDERKIIVPGKNIIRIPWSTNTEGNEIFVNTRIDSFIQKEYVNTSYAADGTPVIDWKVLINPNRNLVHNPKLTEETTNSEGKRVASQYNITKMSKANVDFDGRITELEPVTGMIAFDDSGTAYFPTSIEDSYVLYISTPISFEGQGAITNKITLSGSNRADEVATAAASLEEHMDITKKAGDFNEDTSEVSWEVIFNPKGRHIPRDQAYFKDVPSDDQRFIPSSLKVSPQVPYEIKAEDRGFTLQFNQDINQPIVVTYKMKVERRGAGDTTIFNTVYHGKNYKTIDKVIPGTGEEITKSDFSKDYYWDQKSNELDWTIDVNKNNSDFNSWTVSDKLSSGYMIDHSIIVKDVTTNRQLIENVDYSIELNQANGKIIGFNIRYLSAEQTNHRFVITYKSHFDDNTELQNECWYHYVQKGQEKLDFTSKKFYRQKVKISANKYGVYHPESGEIEWFVGVNNERHPINKQNFLEDSIPADQTYVEGSVTVLEQKFQNTAYVPTDNAQASYDRAGNKTQATFAVGNPNPFQLVFRTVLKNKEDIITKQVKNVAYYQDENTPRTAVEGSVEINNDQSALVKKQGEVSPKDPNIINWKVSINESRFHLKNVAIDDYHWINNKAQFDTLKLVYTSGKDKGKALKAGTDYTIEHTERSFHIQLKNDLTEALELTYDAEVIYSKNDVPGQTIRVGNGVRISGSDFVIVDRPKEVSVPVIIPKSMGIIRGTTEELQVYKVIKGTQTPLKDAVFTLYRGEKKDPDKIVERLTSSGEGGMALFAYLTKGKYLLVEEKAPEGYEISPEFAKGVIIEVTASKDNKVIQQLVENEKQTNKPTEVRGQKIWKDNDNKLNTRPRSITVRLYQNGKEYAQQNVIADASGNWNYAFTNLPKLDEKGAAYNYTVKEDPIKDYSTKIDGTTITNTYENKETTEINGQKVWKDYENKFKTRPVSIKIHLYQNGKEIDAKEVQADKSGSWTYSFTNLTKYDNKGEAYNYTVKEDPVKGYKTSIEGTNITNTYENKETTEISGRKIWKDSDNKFNTRPRSITIRLYQNGMEYTRQNVIADASGNWIYSFMNLPKYDDKGEIYNYTVKEDPVKDYETKVEGTTITNTYENKETTEINGQKIWKDYDNKFNTRPASINIHLYQNDKEFDAKKVQADKTGNWSYSFTNLPKYDAKGEAYNYTVKEDPVKDYETKVEGNNITNTYENKETTEISGKKIWKDYDNKFNTRPATINIHLYQNAKEFDAKKVQADKTGNWSYSFTNLPKYDAKGETYNYTVKEDPVKDYETKVEGTTITNTYENKEFTEISGQKIWQDYKNKFNTRTVSIKIRLFQDGKEYETKEIKPDKTGNWMYSFKNLPKYDDKGEAYNYTVKEDPVKDYKTKVDGTTIINTYENKETTEISGKKIWKDYDNKFKTRPGTINIHLYQNDKKFDFKEIQADKSGNWTYSFTNLPKYDDKGEAYNYTVKEDPVKDYETKVEGTTIINTYENKETTEISGKKIWKDYDNKFKTRPATIDIHLYQNDKEFDSKEIQADKTGNWTYSFTNLPKYDDKGEAYNYTVKEDPVKDYKTKVEGNNITNTYENKETTEISGKKIWKDYDNKFKTRPASINIHLYQNDKEFDAKKVQADKTGNWSYSFTNLPKYDAKGEAYNYTVKEDPVKDYQTKVEGNNITNTYENKETTEINGKKIWKDYDNKFKTRPVSINIHLYQNGEEFGKKEVQADKTGNWTYSFTNLPKYDAKGEAYNYTVKEDPVKDYQTKVEGTTITNRYENNETTEISGQKIWQDYKNKFNTRTESIKIRLYQNGKEFKQQEVNAADNWRYHFVNLPKYDGKGVAYSYSVKEDPVKNYKTKVDGTTIINTYENKETTEISGKKIWKDYENKFKTRPESITVRLLQNDKEYAAKEIKADESGNWAYSFIGLPKYDEQGEAYNYTVKEDPVKEYESEVKGTSITNTYKNKETTEISGEKTWKDYNNKFKTRPESITVRLLQNDEEYATKEIKADESGNWTYSFTDLPKYDEQGEAYNYTVKEDPVKEYKSEVKGTSITNTYKNKETTEISGEKTWKDYNNKFKTRPESITVRLLQNDEEYATKEIKADESGNWAYSFTDLPKYDEQGETYNYTVKEDPVKEYESEVKGTAITNTYKNKETTEISGEKIWKDYNNKFKTRPEAITVRLLQNDEEYAAKEIKADESGNWAYSFTDLPKYDEQGEAYNYTVKEDPVKGYETTIEDTTIINTYTDKEVTEISGQKFWKDNEDKFKTRPKSITVRLYQNNKEKVVKEVKPDESGEWKYNFTNLPKFDKDGKVYDYTLTEDPVKGYETKIEGTNITNTYDFDEPTTKTEKPNRETNTPIMTTSGRTAVTQLPRTGSLHESVLVLLGLLILLCVVSIWYINDKRNRRG
ncbi:Cna B-type domain-containing protein [Candidatus Enterococcus ferrettii]|uniref:Collagen adhesin n=1 Tax=Candidatus Enterococcus ferrettii TaxID=2815324 RepID=A0ABV0EPD7_9ENTE